MKTLCVFFILFFSNASHAQLVGEIQSGRPGQAIGGLVVPVGVFQIQSGFDNRRIDREGQKDTLLTINNIIRLGVADRIEISSLLDYSQNTFERNGIETATEGVSEFHLGFRYHFLREETKWLPTFALQTRFRLKSVGNDFRRDEVAPVFLLALNKTITDEFSATLNWGLSYDGFVSTPTYSYVLSISQDLGTKWSAVYEIYGDETAEVKNGYLGAGAAYLLSPNLQLDTYLSSGNNKGNKEFYWTIGVSWRTLAFTFK